MIHRFLLMLFVPFSLVFFLFLEMDDNSLLYHSFSIGNNIPGTVVGLLLIDNFCLLISCQNCLYFSLDNKSANLLFLEEMYLTWSLTLCFKQCSTSILKSINAVRTR